MGYNGNRPIGKRQEGIREPLDPPSQFSKDKRGLGFELTLLPKKVSRKYHKPQWKAKKKYKEESWQEALFESAEAIRKECEHQEREQCKRQPINQKKEASTKEAHHIQEPTSNKEDSPLD